MELKTAKQSVRRRHPGQRVASKKQLALPAWTNSIALAVIGNTGLWYINQTFDYVLYPYTAIVADSIRGSTEQTMWLTFAIMTPASIAVSLLIIWLHDITGKDWLGLEGLKEFKEATLSVSFPTPPTPFVLSASALYVLLLPFSLLKYLIQATWLRFTKWRYGDALVYIGFSFYDPVYAVIYMRNPATSDQAFFSARDWLLFAGSILIANGLWTPIVSLVAPAIWSEVSSTVPDLLQSR